MSCTEHVCHVRAEALEPYPLADVAIGQEHALAVTQQVGRLWFYLKAVPNTCIICGLRL
jgi:hypothetical protein